MIAPAYPRPPLPPPPPPPPPTRTRHGCGAEAHIWLDDTYTCSLPSIRTQHAQLRCDKNNYSSLPGPSHLASMTTCRLQENVPPPGLVAWRGNGTHPPLGPGARHLPPTIDIASYVRTLHDVLCSQLQTIGCRTRLIEGALVDSTWQMSHTGAATQQPPLRTPNSFRSSVHLGAWAKPGMVGKSM